MKLFRLLLVLLVTIGASAGVNLKNGNFYISYTDIIVPGGGHDLEILRTYNSKATEVGWFGFGWGSDFETYLTVSADGSVVVHENGSGALTRFTPKQAVDPKAAAKKIISEMRKKSPLTPKVAASLEKKLTNDAELRQAYARKFKVSAKIASGTVLYSNVRGLQEIHVKKNQYVRKYNDGKREFFNKEGQLVKVTHKNGYKVHLNYKKGELVSIKDSQAKQLFFDWYPSGLVKHIWSAGKKKTEYKYDGKKNLVWTKDVGGNTYTHSYDGNHNMTGIGYKDKTKMAITYTPKTQFVSEVVARNGDSTKYEYGSNPKNPDYHYWTTIKKKGISGKEVANKYEYEIKARPDGSQYTYRIETVINGLRTETIYSECCSLPVKITRGKHQTTFKYNKKGLLEEKSSSKGEFVKLSYHKKFNKITKVKNNNGWTEFQYDKNGNLYIANNDKGKSVLLTYDIKGRIKTMIDKNKKSKKTRKLSFIYNSLDKPIEIKMHNVGKINVAYDNYGEIKKVESKAGHKMALQVTQAFQSLISIVKPAGVNLNM